MGTKMLILVIAATFFGVLAGCKALPSSSDQLSAFSSALTDSNRSPVFDVELYKGSTLVYKESTAFGAFQMEEGAAYTLKLNSNFSDATFALSFDSGTPIQLAPGTYPVPSAAIPMPVIGNHTVKLVASVDGTSSLKSYTLAVSCDAATSSGFAVDSTKIAVSGSLNVYNYGAAGIASGGIGPYECAWDFNGDGMRDSDYAPCETAVQAYSNHVDSRKIRVFVRDTMCNKILTAQANRTLTAPDYAGVLALAPAKVYITGTISSANTNPALNLRHLSTNPGGGAPKVQCNYSRSGGKGVFTVDGLNSYGLASSRSHGLRVSFSNITDTVNELTQSGGLDGTTAKVQSVTFTTDEAPDVMSRLTFNGTTPACTGQITLTAKEIAGVPCSGGTTGIDGQYLVSATGTFSCSQLSSGTTTGPKIDINSGAFFCEYRLVDQCIGGGGGGGGGVDPIKL